MLVTERAGRLRIVRNGVLDPTPIAGVPEVTRGRARRTARRRAASEVRREPASSISPTPRAREDKLTTTALARGAASTGTALADVKEIFVANTWSKSSTNYGGRIAFDRAGFLFLTVGERQEQDRAQKPRRSRRQGAAAARRRHARRRTIRSRQGGLPPEIYSLGHRSPQGLAVHPETGALWENEHGPLGGDEINIVLPGTQLRLAAGDVRHRLRRHEDQRRDDASGSRVAVHVLGAVDCASRALAFYTGDRFPAWKGNVFVGAMFEGRTRGTGHLRRITFNEGPADSARADPDRAAPAHPRRAAGARRVCSTC